MSLGLKPAIGKWVVGKEEFWNRQLEMRQFINYLKERQHILIVAQRRIGKTSVMKEAARRLCKTHLCLYIDMQDIDSPEAAVLALCLSVKDDEILRRKNRVGFQRAISKLGNIENISLYKLSASLKGLFSWDWKIKGEAFFQSLVEHSKPAVVLIDELPVMVNRMLKGNDYKITADRRKKTDQFLSWIRKVSIKYVGKIGLVIAGSIGLAPILKQAGLSHTISTFRKLKINAWDGETAIGCVRELAKYRKLKLSEGTEEKILQKLHSYIPGHVQLIFDEIVQECEYRGVTECSPELVDEIYAHKITKNRNLTDLSTFTERLRPILGEKNELIARTILSEIAAREVLSEEEVKTMLTEHDGSSFILDVLLGDGYLDKQDEEYSFKSHLLRDWWRENIKS